MVGDNKITKRIIPTIKINPKLILGFFLKEGATKKTKKPWMKLLDHSGCLSLMFFCWV